MELKELGIEMPMVRRGKVFLFRNIVDFSQPNYMRLSGGQTRLDNILA